MSVSRRDTRQADHEDCQSVSTLVMALFDGEADELQARRARKHLLICQTCANRWLDWNRARSLLLSVPAPTPPETLVWRVLSACRRAGAQRSRPVATANSLSAAPPRVTPLEGPPALSHQILERTTRAGANSSRRVTWNTRRWNSRRALTWPALAAPSLALWLLLLQREPLLTSAQVSPDSSDGAASSLDSRFPTSPARANLAARNRRARLRPAATLRVAALRSVDADGATDSSTNTNEIASTEVESRRAEVQPTLLMASSEIESAKTRVLSDSDIRLARQWNEIQTLTSQAARSVNFQPSESGNTSWQTADYAVESAPYAAPRRRARALTALRFTRAAPVALRGAKLSSERTSPRLRAANWRISPLRAASGSATLPAAPSRVSLPISPAPSSVRLLADNFDAEENRADDGRLDEMRSVVDDFRATVAAENTPTDDGTDDLG